MNQKRYLFFPLSRPILHAHGFYHEECLSHCVPAANSADVPRLSTRNYPCVPFRISWDLGITFFHEGHVFYIASVQPLSQPHYFMDTACRQFFVRPDGWTTTKQSQTTSHSRQAHVGFPLTRHQYRLVVAVPDERQISHARYRGKTLEIGWKRLESGLGFKGFRDPRMAATPVQQSRSVMCTA